MAKRGKSEKEETGKVLYRKIGGGSFTLGNRYVKPNQTFLADPDEIPEAFKDVVVPVDAKKVVEEKAKKSLEKVESTEYTLKHKGGGWYNIIDGDGKVINENPMKKDEAAKYLESL